MCKKKNYLLGKGVHHMKSERRKDAYSARCKLCLKTFSLSNFIGQTGCHQSCKKFWTCTECSGKVRVESGHPARCVSALLGWTLCTDKVLAFSRYAGNDGTLTTVF